MDTVKRGTRKSSPGNRKTGRKRKDKFSTLYNMKIMYNHMI